jgi:hypothetical protein
MQGLLQGYGLSGKNRFSQQSMHFLHLNITPHYKNLKEERLIQMSILQF